MNVGSKKGIGAQNFVKALAQSNNSPGIEQCAKMYGYVAQSFEMAIGVIKRDRQAADYNVGVGILKV